jgi:hypothetical protein
MTPSGKIVQVIPISKYLLFQPGQSLNSDERAWSKTHSTTIPSFTDKFIDFIQLFWVELCEIQPGKPSYPWIQKEV